MHTRIRRMGLAVPGEAAFVSTADEIAAPVMDAGR